MTTLRQIATPAQGANSTKPGSINVQKQNVLAGTTATASTITTRAIGAGTHAATSKQYELLVSVHSRPEPKVNSEKSNDHTHDSQSRRSSDRRSCRRWPTLTKTTELDAPLDSASLTEQAAPTAYPRIALAIASATPRAIGGGTAFETWSTCSDIVPLSSKLDENPCNSIAS